MENGKQHRSKPDSEHDEIICALYTIATLLAAQLPKKSRNTRTLQAAAEAMGEIEGYHLRIQELSRGQKKGRNLDTHLSRAARAMNSMA